MHDSAPIRSRVERLLSHPWVDGFMLACACLAVGGAIAAAVFGVLILASVWLQMLPLDGISMLGWFAALSGAAGVVAAGLTWTVILKARRSARGPAVNG